VLDEWVWEPDEGTPPLRPVDAKGIGAGPDYVFRFTASSIPAHHATLPSGHPIVVEELGENRDS
jgi:hypothetical protein